MQGIGRGMWGVRTAWLLLGLLIAIMPSLVFAQDVGEDGRYRLRPGDTIQITVLEDPELDRQVLLPPDGRISMPLAGTFKAEGQTTDGLEATIRSRLRNKFVQPPNVTVSLTSLAEIDEEEEEEIEQAAVYVLGEVARPGRYEYDTETPIDVLQALSLAGGLGPFAARGRIQVREQSEDIQTLRLFDYDAVEDGLINTPRDLAALSDGAIVIVPERGLFE